MKLWVSFAVCMFAAAPALAQPAPKAAAVAVDQGFEKDLDALFVTGGLTADQAAASAAKITPSVLAAKSQVDVAIAESQTSQAARIPVIGARASYSRLSPLPALSFGMGTPPIEFFENSRVFEGTATIPLSDYVVRFPALRASTVMGEKAARSSEGAAGLDAGQQARLTYYEWVRAKLQVIVARHQLTQVQATLKQVRALADVQRLSRADLLRVESQEAQAEQAVDNLQQLSQLREEQLRILIGVGADAPLAIGEDIRVDVLAPPATSLDDLLHTATGNRLDLRSLDQGILAREKQLVSEKANQWPTVSAFGTFDYANPNPRIFPQEDKFKFTWQVGAQVTWTLNGFLVSRAQANKIVAQTNGLRANREDLRRGIRIQLLSAQQQVQLAQHALVTSNKALIAAQESYRVRRELLNAERATAVELVDAQTDLTGAQIAALNARVDLRVALTQLMHALGNDVKAKP